MRRPIYVVKITTIFKRNWFHTDAARWPKCVTFHCVQIQTLAS